MAPLSPEQQRALDDAPEDVPARVKDPVTGHVVVLLKADDFAWIRGIVTDEPDAPRLTDSRTQQDYVLVPEQRYERYKAFFEDDPITPEEQRAMLRAAGLRAGWNDPIWDDWEETTGHSDHEVP